MASYHPLLFDNLAVQPNRWHTFNGDLTWQAFVCR